MKTKKTWIETARDDNKALNLTKITLNHNNWKSNIRIPKPMLIEIKT